MAAQGSATSAPLRQHLIYFLLFRRLKGTTNQIDSKVLVFTSTVSLCYIFTLLILFDY
jgi:hypothetical protein